MSEAMISEATTNEALVRRRTPSSNAAEPMTKAVLQALLAASLLLATTGVSLAQMCPPGSPFANQTCYCPYGTHYSGMSTFTVQCGSACPPCTPDPPPQTQPQPQSSIAPPVYPVSPADTPGEQQEDSPPATTAPSHQTGQYWKVSQSCMHYWDYFHRYATHGAFAVTKTLDGGCGWSWMHPGGRSRPMGTMRREALQTCAQYGPDCKIIGEK